jgi:DNA-binding NtrC family response regulator
LSIVPITIPPLRERTSDIPFLVHHFLRKFQEGGAPIRIDPEALEHLKTHSWSGNVRELMNVIQQMMVFSRGNTITVKDLPPHLFTGERSVPREKEGKIELEKMVSDLEKKWIQSKLKESDWNQEKAAKLLGITRKMLTNRMAKYHLRPPQKRG